MSLRDWSILDIGRSSRGTLLSSIIPGRGIKKTGKYFYVVSAIDTIQKMPFEHMKFGIGI